MLAALAAGIAAVPPTPSIEPRQLLEGGDCLSDEVLAWRRLRAERKVAVELDESAPIVCRDASAGKTYLATGSGKFLVSVDDGRTFGLPSNIVVSRTAVSDVQAMGVLAGGTIVLVYRQGSSLLVSGSTDRGASWSHLGEVTSAGYGRMEADGVRLVQLADGTLLLPVSAWSARGGADPEGLVLASRDGGRTWSGWGSLGARCAGASLTRLRSGELLAALHYRGARRDGDPATESARDELFNNMVVARSTDGGKSWSDHRCVTRFREAPGDLLQLSDGTVVLTYGEQNFPYGARAVVSRDGGRTWDPNTYILGFSTVQLDWSSGPMPTKPGWHVSSIAGGDNTILTLYTRGSYVSARMLTRPKLEWKEPAERGRAVLSVRWALEGLKKPPLGAPAGVTLLGKPNADGYLDNGRCQIKPEHLQWGGDYYSYDEILVYKRIPAESRLIGPADSPIVCYDPAGNLVVAVGSGQIYASKDNGRTWSQTASGPDGVDIKSFGILRDGTMLISPGSDVYRSEDGGKSWVGPVHIDPSPFEQMGLGEGYRINQLPDGTVLLTCGNLYLKGGMAEDYDMPWDGVWRSRDGGRTWGDFSYIGHPSCETNLLRLKSGRLMAAIRFQGTRSTDDFMIQDPHGYRNNFVKNAAVAFSSDDGYTWTPPRTITRYNECPADLAEAADGTVVMSFMQKNNPNGARAMVSRDQGKTWDETQYMISWWEVSGIFTSSIALKDGRILTMGGGYSPSAQTNLLQAKIWKPLAAR